MVEKGKVIHKNDEYWGKKVDNAVDNDDFIHKNPMRWHVEKWISLIHNCGQILIFDDDRNIERSMARCG